jgi:hypothetical protein
LLLKAATDPDPAPERIAAAHPNVEVFAYGCGGYGTLQEYMILDGWIDGIRPDAIVWQFCSNDMFNNDLQLEASSYGNNNQMTRPYLIDGEIVYAYPFQDFGPLYNLPRHSVILQLMNLHLNSLKSPGEGIEAVLTPDHPWIQRSLETTEQIMRRVLDRAGMAPVAALSVDSNPWAPGQFEEICGRIGIAWLHGVPEAIDVARERGQTVDGLPYDAHWNPAGHAIAAEVLSKRFVEAKLLGDIN